jgi:hypothetical protein
MSHDITGFTYRGLDFDELSRVAPHKFTPVPGVHIRMHLMLAASRRPQVMSRAGLKDGIREPHQSEEDICWYSSVGLAKEADTLQSSFVHG